MPRRRNHVSDYDLVELANTFNSVFAPRDRVKLILEKRGMTPEEFATLERVANGRNGPKRRDAQYQLNDVYQEAIAPSTEE